MKNNRFLVVGATGHVGSQVAVNLANRGYDVTALVRKEGSVIQDPYQGKISYVTGDLASEVSLRKAVRGIDVVISTANGVVPQHNGGDAGSVNQAALSLIKICEEAGIKRFVQSSVPTYKGENHVPELRGKRLLEQRLLTSSMQSIIIRNPAFMDVFLVFSGFAGAEAKSFHATTKRQYGYGKFWLGLVGNLVEKHGMLIAPGGANHGTPMITTRDVAEMLVGGALYEGTDNLLIEAGGPEWLTWREIAGIIARKTGRKSIRIIPLPAWIPRLNQVLARPFSASVANTFALMSFVADYQPRWSSKEAIRILKLPEQMTLSDYLDANYKRKP
jgi:uncharacterized protein YbjT (DUF2867 family)